MPTGAAVPSARGRPKVCATHAQGRCKNNSKCIFVQTGPASVSSSAQSGEDRDQPCSEWETTGSCPKSGCGYRHAAENRNMHVAVLNETLVQDPDHRSQQATLALMQADVTRRYQELEHLRLGVLVDLEVRRRVDEESRRMAAANFERALQERVLQANDHLLRSLQHLRVQPPVTSTTFPPTSPSSNITAPSAAPVARLTPKHIQQPCPAWKKSGNCPQGAGCKYQHSPPSRRTGEARKGQQPPLAPSLDTDQRTLPVEQPHQDKKQSQARAPLPAQPGDVEIRRRAEQSRLSVQRKHEQHRCAHIVSAASCNEDVPVQHPQLDETETHRRAERSHKSKQRHGGPGPPEAVPRSNWEHTQQVKVSESDAPRLAEQGCQEKERATIVQAAEEYDRLKTAEQARQIVEKARCAEEIEARLVAEEAARIESEAEARRCTEQKRRDQQRAEIIRAAEEYDRRKAAEAHQAAEVARRIAEGEARRIAEETRRAAEQQAILIAKEDARRKEEEDNRLRAEEEARLKAEEDTSRRAERNRQRKERAAIVKAAKDYDRRKAAEHARLVAEEARRTAADQARVRAQEAARLKAEEEDARRRAEEAERLRAAEEELEQARRVREQAQEAQFQARSAKEAAFTLKHVALGSIITFAAGLEIRDLVPAFECRMVQIKNLPADAQVDEIRGLFGQLCIEAERFHLLPLKPARSGRQQATVVIPVEILTVVSSAINGVHFRNNKMEFEVCGNHLSGGMNISASPNASLLSVSWRGPSVRFVAEYDELSQAQAKVKALNKTIHGEHRLSVDMNVLPPGRIVTGYNPASIRIQGLPRTITEDTVRALAETTRIRRLPYKNGIEAQVSPDHAFTQILHEVEQLSPGNIVCHERLAQERDRELEGIVSFGIRFSSTEAACLVHDRLQGRVFPGVSPQALWLTPPQPFSFTISISREQYEAQKKLWDRLSRALSERKECTLSAKRMKDVVYVRLFGRERPAIGIAKVRVETLASGDLVNGWNRSLCSPNNGFFRQVSRDTGAHIRVDWRKHAIYLYGESGPIESARAMVQAELKRLETQEHTVVLKATSVGFFVRRGLAALKGVVGADAVDFHSSARRITVTGGEKARHHLERLLKESENSDRMHPPSTTDHDCAICFCAVASPSRIGCGHVYCEGCLVDWFTNAVENEQLPIRCVADEARCGRPVAIPTIQKYLPQAKMRELLEGAAKWHIRTAADFQYCKTTDCTQIYRMSDQASVSVLQCPACFAEVCTGCGQDGHQDVSCEEQRRIMLQWSLDEGWMGTQGLKKCPSCGQGIQKKNGCNRITCRCGSHFCWLCLFCGSDIYGHLNKVHGL